jgi:hypothetical protein
MRYYTQEIYKSIKFYSYYFVPYINLDMFIIMKLYKCGQPFEIENAKQTVEKHYEENIRNSFNEKILYYSELRQYLIDENSNIIPLNNYNFSKLRLYAIRCLDCLNEAENAIIEKKINIEKGKYSRGLKELVKCSFQDYDVVFKKENDGLIVRYYNDEEKTEYIYKFTGIEQTTNVVEGERFSCIVCEEVLEEKGLFIYNMLVDNKISDGGGIIEFSLKFNDAELMSCYHQNLSIRW